MKTIPNYALYGEQAENSWSSAFNFEWIPERSAPYNWEIQTHVHDAFVQVLYLTSGSVELLLDDAKWHVPSPCILVVPAQTVHAFHFSPDVNGPVITAGQKFLESLASVAMPSLISVIRTPAVFTLNPSTRHADALMPLLLAMEREWQTHSPGKVAAAMVLMIAIFVQISRIGHNTDTPSVSGNSRKTAQLEKFRALIDTHFKQQISVDAYAGKLGVTAGQLSRICREVLGMSALDVINARVIHEAERDLIYTSVPIKQLAAFLGFGDEAYFGRFFKKHTGVTPREFRIKALADMSDGRK